MTSSPVKSFPDQIVAFLPFIRRQVQRYLKNQEDIEDLTQDVVLRALMNEQKFEADTNLRAWLKVLVRNHFINEYRARKREGIRLDLSDMLYEYGIYQNSSQNEGTTTFQVEDAKKKLAVLSIDLQKTIQLRFHGYKYQEIATILGIPPTTVRTRIFRAKKLLATAK